MSWNDWEAVWRTQNLPPPMASLEDLKRSFELQRRALSVRLLIRNVSEGVAGLGLSSFLCFLAAKHGAWHVYISAAVILGVTSVFIGDAIRQRGRRLGPEAPLIERINSEIVELRHQRNLIRSWWLWYLLPLIAAMGLALWSLGRANFGAAPAGFITDLLKTPATAAWIVVLLVVTGLPLQVGIRAQQAAMAKVEPRIAELQRLRFSLVTGDDERLP